MTDASVRKLGGEQSRLLQSQLLEVFRFHDLDVAVGITSDGVMIGSQDERVDAYNIGEVSVQRRISVCGCRRTCGDLAESDDNALAVCRGLPRP